MKKLIYVLAIAGLTFTACSDEAADEAVAEPTIEGTWQLDEVSGEELTESEKQSTMTINADGTMEQNMGGEPRTGTWTMSDDGKTLSCSVDGRDAEFTNVACDAEKLSFNEGDDRITFIRK